MQANCLHRKLSSEASGVAAASRLMSSKSTDAGWCLMICTGGGRSQSQEQDARRRSAHPLFHPRTPPLPPPPKTNPVVQVLTLGGGAMTSVRLRNVKSRLYLGSSARKLNLNCSTFGFVAAEGEDVVAGQGSCARPRGAELDRSSTLCT